MKKKKVRIIISVVVFVILFISYLYIINNENSDDDININADNSVITQYNLLNKTADEVKGAVITSANGVIEYVNNKSDTQSSNWTIKNYESIEFNNNEINNVIGSFAQLTSNEIITENPTNLSQFGLNPPQLTAEIEYTDGSRKTLFLGNKTPDNDYYYTMIDGDSNVYIIDSINGERYSYTLNDLISKDIPLLYADKINYINVKQKDKMELEVYSESEESKESKNYGVQTMKMTKPVQGINVYLSEIQNSLFYNISELSLKKLVDIFPNNLNKYGLDNPYLEITIKDSEDELKLKIGNDIDSDTAYCMINNRPHVFSIEKNKLNPFINIDILKFIDKSVLNIDRSKLDSVNIRNDDMVYEILFIYKENTEENNTSESKNQISAKINGYDINEVDFKNFYDLIAGLAFDNIIESTKPEGEAEVSFTFNFKDGTNQILNFYSYNENFYLIETNGICEKLINKQIISNITNNVYNLISK